MWSLQKSACLLLCLALSQVVRSYDVCLDGVYYDLTGNEATVTNNGEPKCYSGNVAIPPTIAHEHTVYAVTAIAPLAFNGCTGLTGVSIPATVKTVGDDAFKGCPCLPVADKLFYAGTYLVTPYECSVTGTYIIRDGTRWIGNRAFNERPCITYMDIPASVEHIGKKAFYLCTFLKTVTLNSSADIGDSVFAETTAITDFNIYCTQAPPIANEDNAFSETTCQTATLHVLKGCKNLFKTAYGWRKFVNIVDDLEPAGIHSVKTSDNNTAVHYDTCGRRIEPSQKGIHIVQTPSGASRKILIQ